MGDFDDRGLRCMLADGCSGGGIVHDYGARHVRDAFEHRIRKITGVGAGTGALFPQLTAELAGRFAVVVDEFVYVVLGVEHPEKKMLQYRVMQYDDARL